MAEGKALMELARKGGGIYNPINSGMSAINQLLDHFERMQKREVEQRSYTDFESYFQYFLFLGILFFCLFFFLPEGKIPKSIDSLKS